MNKRQATIVIALGVLIILLSVAFIHYCLHFSSGKISIGVSENNINSATTQPLVVSTTDQQNSAPPLASSTPENILIPNGWKMYHSDKFKIQFSYPDSWKIIEYPLQISVIGDGSSILITPNGIGDGNDSWKPASASFIGGFKTWSAWEQNDNLHHFRALTVIVDSRTWFFRINTAPNVTNDVTDSILSSVILLK